MQIGIIIILIASVFILACIVLGYVMLHVAYHPKRHYDKWDEKFMRTRFQDSQYDTIVRWKKETPFQAITITSFDHLKLAAKLYRKNSGQLVILLHGFETNSNTNLEVIKFYYEQNISVLAIDLRAHQDSEGYYVSYGHLERRDLRDWIEYMSANYTEYQSIYLHGFSLGAATCLRVSDVAFPKVKLIISDCGFATSTGAIKFSFKSRGHGYLPFRPIYFFSLIFNYFATKAWVPHSKPINHVKASLYPILFIQSSNDTFIPAKMANALYASCPTKKELIYFEAPHILASKYFFNEYTTKVMEFIENNR